MSVNGCGCEMLCQQTAVSVKWLTTKRRVAEMPSYMDRYYQLLFLSKYFYQHQRTVYYASDLVRYLINVKYAMDNKVNEYMNEWTTDTPTIWVCSTAKPKWPNAHISGLAETLAHRTRHSVIYGVQIHMLPSRH